MTRCLLIAILLVVAACGGAAQHRIDTARVPVNAAAATLLELDDVLAGWCSRQACAGDRWVRVVRALETARHTILAADDALEAADGPEQLGAVLACVASAMSRALAAAEAAGIRLPPTLSGWQQQTGIPGALCHWEPAPGASVGRGSAEGE